MKIINLFSPNYNRKKRLTNSIKFIVIHYTGMQSERESIKKLRDSKSNVSSHYLISRNGLIYKLVKEKHVAWHAGHSRWGGYKNLNNNSIGIELVNKGHQFGYTSFKKEQISNLLKLCKKLVKKYNIKARNILGHSDISPTRKIDPGEKFPWKYLAIKGIGIWHDCESNLLRRCRRLKVRTKQNKNKFLKNLKNIGYCFPNNGKNLYIKTVKAFQRRFRKELINGILDQECFIIAQNLANKLQKSS